MLTIFGRFGSCPNQNTYRFGLPILTEHKQFYFPHFCIFSKFQNSHVALSDWLKVIHLFSCDLQLYQIQNLMKHLSKKTVIGMLKKLRNVCKEEVERTNTTLVFGDEVEMISHIEIDEAYFGKKRKDNKGKCFKKQWVFGITERGSNKVFFKIIDDRKKRTLLPIISKYVSHSAMIHHDDWPAYRSLHDLGYSHIAVKHTKQFKAANGACINTIEGIWGVVKQRISRMHGVELSKLDSYLNEYAFRYSNKKNMLNALILAISNSKY